MVDKYGADTCRLFVLFAAPPEKDMPWIEASVGGQRRFLERVWRFVTRNIDRDAGAGDPAADRRALRKLHQTIHKVTDDFSNRWHFNTSIAALMELINTLTEEEAKSVARGAGSDSAVAGAAAGAVRAVHGGGVVGAAWPHRSGVPPDVAGVR